MTEAELARFKNASVAIGGLGLGGAIFMNLVRLGVERFHIADPDVYERVNFNRQRMARESTIGRRKDECLLEEALDVNPDLRVQVFREGVKPGNVDAFLDGVQYVVDVVDLFAMSDKIMLNEEARRRKLPVVSCASLGFSGCAVAFENAPGSPSFTELSGLSPRSSDEENLRRFFAFIAPEVPAYMRAQTEMAMTRSSHIPFAVPGVEIAASLAATVVSKWILGRGQQALAPQGIYVDPFELKLELFEASYRRAEAREGKRLQVAGRRKAA